MIYENSCMLQEFRDKFFSKMFRVACSEQIFSDELDLLRDEILGCIIQDSYSWDNIDYDPDLKMSAFCLAIDLCICDWSDERNCETGKAIRNLLNNDMICATLKRYILGRNKTEKVNLCSTHTFLKVNRFWFEDALRAMPVSAGAWFKFTFEHSAKV